MRYEIILAPEANEDLKRLEARVRKAVKEGIEKHLRHEPARLSKSRIKRLRGLRRPQYRLRIGEVRIFYDVAEGAVQVFSCHSEIAGYRLAQGGRRTA